MNLIDNLEEAISEYYDNELPRVKLIHLEAKFANSKILENYSEQMCYSFFKISNSIKLVKLRAKNLDLFMDLRLPKRRKETIFQRLFHFFQEFQ